MSRNTRERILLTALALFNEAGEPHVTTNRIADELDISPGNLHYHFHTKADLILALFERFEQRMLELLSAPEQRAVHLEDIWFFLHLVFETIGEHRFIYRDLTDLCGRYRGLHQRFRAILKLSMTTAHHLIEGLMDQGQLKADAAEVHALVRNITLVSTFWLAFDQIFERDGQPQPDRAAWQVMSLVGPYLQDEARDSLRELAEAYRSGGE